MKILILFAFIIFSNFCYSQKTDSSKEIEIDELVSKDDSLSLIYYHVREKIRKSKLDSILNDYEMGRTDLKLTRIRLMMTSIFGDTWELDSSSKSNNYLKLNSYSDLVKFFNQMTIYASQMMNDDGSIKKSISVYQDGSVEIIEKQEEGRYLKKKIDHLGNISFEYVDNPQDYSNFQMSTETISNKNVD